MNAPPRTLLIDADDTLWENNIYFEDVASRFLTRLVAGGIELARAQQVLWETEQRNVTITGYGSKAFCKSLHETAACLKIPNLEPWIDEQEQWIFHHPIELLPGVRATLPLLFSRNQLILVTKGFDTEQRNKLERSGMAGFFHGTEILFEKSRDAYQLIIERHQLDAPATWMIGNSPRSDINPAKAAGLRFIVGPPCRTRSHPAQPGDRVAGPELPAPDRS